MVGNLQSKFGHARPSGSRVICYCNVCDGRTDGQTKATLIARFPTGGHNKYLCAIAVVLVLKDKFKVLVLVLGAQVLVLVLVLDT